jgi:flagellar biogenesis protein FliO
MLRALTFAAALAAACAPMALPAAALAADAPQAAGPATSIPFKKEEREPSADWTHAFAALAVAAAVGWGALYLLRRTRIVPAALRASSRIRLVETARIDARVTLYLVSAEGRGFLLGRCGDSLVLLKDFDAPVASRVSERAAA